MKAPPQINKGSIGPYLDIQVEAQGWLDTFEKYQNQVRLIPIQALEKKAMSLRIRLLKEFKTIRLGKGQAKREMKARGGRIKVRKSIRDKFQKGNTFMGALLNRKSRVLVDATKRKKDGTKKKVRRAAWYQAVLMELSARQRSRSLLAGSWVNKAHQTSDVRRTATYSSKLKSSKLSNEVKIETMGNNPRITLTNIIDAIGSVGTERGIIARAIRAESDDMNKYLERKAEALNAKMKAGTL